MQLKHGPWDAGLPTWDAGAPASHAHGMLESDRFSFILAFSYFCVQQHGMLGAFKATVSGAPVDNFKVTLGELSVEVSHVSLRHLSFLNVDVQGTKNTSLREHETLETGVRRTP